MLDVVQRFVRAWTYKDMPWREAQEAGLLWAPLRKPHENALDEHWLARKTFAEVEHPGARPLVPLSDQQMAQQQDELAGRPARAAARRGHRRRCSARPRGARSVPAHAAPGREPAPLGAARQAVPAAGHQDLRFRLVSRLGRRHAVSRRDGRGELQGRVEGQSRYAARGDGAGRRPRRARRRDRPAAGGQGPRHGRQFPQQELRQARHLAQHPPPEGLADRQGHGAHLRCRRRGVLAGRACSAWGSATTC